MFVGLVQDPHWEPPDGFPEPERHRRTWHVPWGAIAYIALFCVMLALVPEVSDAFGALAGFGFLCLAIAIGGWRLDRWLSRQYWRGLRDYQA